MGGLFPKPVKPDAPSAPPSMPDMMDPAVMEARRRRLATEQGRMGREATILSGGTGGMGPGGKTTLG